MAPSRRSIRARGSPRGLGIRKPQKFGVRKAVFADRNQLNVLEKGLQILRNDRNGDTQGTSEASSVDSTSRKAPMRVAVRVRPLNSRENTANCREIISVQGPNMLIFDPERKQDDFFFKNQKIKDVTARKYKNQKFAFDHVYDATGTNRTIYDDIMKPLLDTLLSGFNCSVFAYGATGSGKTYTMLGSDGNPGLTYLTINELYERLEAMASDYETGIQISYFEVYNEQVRDLLNHTGKQLTIMEVGTGITIKDLSFHRPMNIGELLEMLRNGNLHRSQHPTDHNAESSRSHAVLQVEVGMRARHKDISSSTRSCKLVMVDLAGSEKGCATGFSGQRFREGSSINKSLLALGKIMEALAMGKKTFSFRDSKLTRILKDSLGGNCRTVMIANISPAENLYEDTLNTLRYAQKAKKIACNATKNVITVQSCLSEYTRVVNEMAAKIEDLERQLKAKDDMLQEKDRLLCEKEDLISNLNCKIITLETTNLVQESLTPEELELAALCHASEANEASFQVYDSDDKICCNSEDEKVINATVELSNRDQAASSAHVPALEETFSIVQHAPLCDVGSGHFTDINVEGMELLTDQMIEPGQLDTLESHSETLKESVEAAAPLTALPLEQMQEELPVKLIDYLVNVLLPFNTTTRNKIEKLVQDIELKSEFYLKLRGLHNETADPRYEKTSEKIARKIENLLKALSTCLKKAKEYKDSITTYTVDGAQAVSGVRENVKINQCLLKIAQSENRALGQLVTTLSAQLLRKEEVLKEFAVMSNKMLNTLKHYEHLAPGISETYDKLVSSYCSPSLKFAEAEECSISDLDSMERNVHGSVYTPYHQGSLFVDIVTFFNKIENKIASIQSKVVDLPEVTTQVKALLEFLRTNKCELVHSEGPVTGEDIVSPLNLDANFDADMMMMDSYLPISEVSVDVANNLTFEADEEIKENADPVFSGFKVPDDALRPHTVADSLTFRTVQDTVDMFSRPNNGAIPSTSESRPYGALKKPTIVSPGISPQNPVSRQPTSTSRLPYPATGPHSVSPKRTYPLSAGTRKTASSTGKTHPASAKIISQRSPYSKSKKAAITTLRTGQQNTHKKVITSKPNPTPHQKGVWQRPTPKQSSSHGTNGAR